MAFLGAAVCRGVTIAHRRSGPVSSSRFRPRSGYGKKQTSRRGRRLKQTVACGTPAGMTTMSPAATSVDASPSQTRPVPSATYTTSQLWG